MGESLLLPTMFTLETEAEAILVHRLTILVSIHTQLLQYENQREGEGGRRVVIVWYLN